MIPFFKNRRPRPAKSATPEPAASAAVAVHPPVYSTWQSQKIRYPCLAREKVLCVQGSLAEESSMRFSPFFLVFVCLLLANPAFSQGKDLFHERIRRRRFEVFFSQYSLFGENPASANPGRWLAYFHLHLASKHARADHGFVRGQCGGLFRYRGRAEHGLHRMVPPEKARDAYAEGRRGRSRRHADLGLGLSRTGAKGQVPWRLAGRRAGSGRRRCSRTRVRACFPWCGQAIQPASRRRPSAFNKTYPPCPFLAIRSGLRSLVSLSASSRRQRAMRA